MRGARKLIDVDRVSAMMGTWASWSPPRSRRSAGRTAPLFTVSGADSITLLPHQGYIFRTQPNSLLQIASRGQLFVAKGATRLTGGAIALRPSSSRMRAVAEAGGHGAASFIYERDKTTSRSEVDQLMRSYPTPSSRRLPPDTTVLLRDIYRAATRAASSPRPTPSTASSSAAGRGDEGS